MVAGDPKITASAAAKYTNEDLPGGRLFVQLCVGFLTLGVLMDYLIRSRGLLNTTCNHNSLSRTFFLSNSLGRVYYPSPRAMEATQACSSAHVGQGHDAARDFHEDLSKKR